MNWPTFFTRLGSAIVFAAIMMCGLLWKDWMFVIVIATIQMLCLRDYFKLMGKIFEVGSYKTLIWISQLAGLAIIFSIWYLSRSLSTIALVPGWHTPVLSPTQVSSPAIVLWPCLLFLPGLILLYALYNKEGGLKSSIIAMGGLLYIVLPCTLLIILHQIARYLPLALILMIWMNDTMAYIVGSFIGKTPFSSISPKKTWEGTAGGAILTVAGAAICAHYIPHQSMPLYIGLALCAAIAGTAGDLFESKLKRIAGVKDSGTMMPGHGGALDRFDSLLVATPFAFAVAYIALILSH